MSRAWRWLGAGIGLLVVGETAWLVTDGLIDDVDRADVVVVLGNQVLPDGTPHPRLAARLEAARACYEAGCASAVLVSGGVGQEGFSEADVMVDWLAARGVPRTALYRDPEGNNTRLTARHTADQMRAEGWSRAIVATQFFHVTRCKLAFRQAGITDVGSVHARYMEPRDAYALAREVVGLWGYLLGFR